ncbi:MAG: L,D-transpeptidase Cds6 family protein [Pyrinomonadaceae bacterium]
MKYCPGCQTNYTDDTLKFCLQDGTLLISGADSQSQSQMPTIAFTDSETLVSPRRVEQLHIPIEDSQARDWEPSQQTKITTLQPETKKSNTALVVALTALVTLLVFGGTLGAWFYFKNNKNEVTQNTNNKVMVNQKPVNSVLKDNINTEVSPSPTATIKDSSPTATPTAAPPPPDFNPETVKKEISDKINAWKSATESGDVNGYMNYYADTIDYYTKKGVSAGYVRNDKEKAFSKFDNISINLSNMRVTPGASGENATAVFDKEWTFEGEENYSAGKVQTQLQMKKINGKWVITSERDLKIYYTEQ